MNLGIGGLFHLSQVGTDLAPLDAWYAQAFSPRYHADHHTDIFPTWPAEKRDAWLFVIADAGIEIMAPARHLDGPDQYPVARFLSRFGPHWHSVAWYVDDVGVVYHRLTAHGIRVVVGGAPDSIGLPSGDDPLFTHPKDTGVALEFMLGPTVDDPRYLPGWSNDWWAENHPLGLRGLSHITVAVPDQAKALELFVGVLGSEVIGETTSELDASHSAFVQVGPNTVVELATPDDANSLMGRDVAANGSTLHAATWRVRDLDAAAAHLAEGGVRVLARDDSSLVLDPATTCDSVVRLTTAPPAGRAAAVKPAARCA